MNYLEELIQNRAKEVHYDDFLRHHGVKGQKWNMRRYQYEDDYEDEDFLDELIRREEEKEDRKKRKNR